MLHLHRAERADLLVGALADVIADPLADPMVPEVVAVPTRGVERWLSQRLAAHLGATPGNADGVCANLDFPFPGRLVGGAVAAACGVEPDADAWAPERAVWPLLELAEECLAEPWLGPLAAHLGGDAAEAGALRRTRRFGVIRHLTDLYDRYGVHRPGMIRAWVAGEDVDASGSPLAPDVAWQAGLWRCLRDHLGVPSPAERLEDATARISEDPGLVDLPHRVAIFGLTRLPASYLAVLTALAAGRDVHLFLLHPSPALWAQVAPLARDLPTPLRRADVPAAAVPRNPLLASWGQDAREMQLVLTRGGTRLVDHHHPLRQGRRTLLERLQDDVRSDRMPPGAPLPGRPDTRPLLDAADRSLQVHACHGRARQVEVARDAILHLLADDPTLEPRDIVVMCPDIETFAPLVHAAFDVAASGAEPDDPAGGQGAGRLPDVRVRLADRSLRQTNPVLGVVADLLALADARVTASQVLDLAGREPVRRRFRLSDDDLERIEDWVSAVGVRWGFDAQHRAPWKLDKVADNTWHSGLDRLLLGVAMSEDDHRLVGGTLPHDDVESGDIDVTGRLAELIGRLEVALASLRQPQPVADWARAIAAAADTLTATAGYETWQRLQLHRLLDEVVAEATSGGRPCATPIALPEVRALLADRLRGRPTRANFRTGHLTVCTLVPMRSVPHRVVCLLGLDDGAFPRRTVPDGDDLVDRDPHVGDRNPRSEDRQLLLDALLAATDHLIVTYAGHDERTNAARAPAVPVGELLDVVDRTVRTGRSDDDGAEVPARSCVRRAHPLQPFDARNFARGAIHDQRPWSFDEVALEGAVSMSRPRAAPEGFLDGPLPEDPADIVELDDLVRFVQHPVRAFLRQRLGVSLADYTVEPADSLPVELDGLQRWEVGQRLLDARLAGVEEQRCLAAERARGGLPPGALGHSVVHQVLPTVAELVAVAEEVVGADREPASLEVGLAVAGGALAGTVAPVTGDVLWSVTYSRVAAKHRLAAWVRLLAATAARPERPFQAVTIGRSGGAGRVTVARIRPLDGDAGERRTRALGHLGVLVDLYRRGMREPLPLYCATSAAYSQARRAGRDADAAAAGAWESGYQHDGEDRQEEHRLVLGGARTFAQLLDEAPRSDERGDGWAGDETTRFGRYARRLWDGLLSCEEVGHR